MLCVCVGVCVWVFFFFYLLVFIHPCKHEDFTSTFLGCGITNMCPVVNRKSDQISKRKNPLILKLFSKTILFIFTPKNPVCVFV